MGPGPGSAVRHASVARHVTDCATRPGFFQYNDMINTSKFLFHNPLSIKKLQFLRFFLYIMKVILLLISVDRLFCTCTLSIQNTKGT